MRRFRSESGFASGTHPIYGLFVPRGEVLNPLKQKALLFLSLTLGQLHIFQVEPPSEVMS